jgi:predicted DNA-binding protein (MmcQ/YjbR family)
MQVIDHKALETYLLTKPGARLDYPFGADVAVYKVADKMFALIPEKRTPLNISLKCDPQLAIHLREKYEEVMPGYHLNKRHWNTIVATGQLSLQEICDLIDHSYSLVISGLSQTDRQESGLEG